MKLDALLNPASPADIPSLARGAEELGFDGLWIGETQHDALLAAALAAEHTGRVDIGTAVTMAFTKSPMALAYTCWDLQSLAKGRFILGLGSQVKGHLERRFSIPWTAPVPKMREVIQSLRAIWSTWQTGEPLEFRGEHYSFSLMTPFFNPGPIEHPAIPIYLAAVNRVMARLAGELCEGIHVHPLHTVRYVREVLRPAVERGAQRSGRSASDITFAAPFFAATGETSKEAANTREIMRHQIAFYASTRTYRAVLDLHEWGEVGDRLHKLSVAKRWDEMPKEVSNEMLEEFAVEATLDELPAAVRDRYEGVLDRVSLYLPFDAREDWWATLLGDFRGLAKGKE